MGIPIVKFGYTITYVADVAAAIEFYRAAFGFEKRFMHEDGENAYAELDTGQTVMAFASHQVAETILADGYVKVDQSPHPIGFEMAMVTDDVESAIERAITAGASLIAPAQQKPWGQTVAYVRAPDGMLIEICTPVAS